MPRVLDQTKWNMKLDVEEFIDKGALSWDLGFNPGKIPLECWMNTLLGGVGKMIAHAKKSKNV